MLSSEYDVYSGAVRIDHIVPTSGFVMFTAVVSAGLDDSFNISLNQKINCSNCPKVIVIDILLVPLNPAPVSEFLACRALASSTHCCACLRVSSCSNHIFALALYDVVTCYMAGANIFTCASCFFSDWFVGGGFGPSHAIWLF